MASSSSFTSRNFSYNVFASFHGEDVRKTLLSHIREQFNRNGITMFNDQEIERSATIAPSLKKAIEESRILIVILSQRYASSGWCLDELVEIMETKKDMGQIVMTIFYGVDPSHIRKQIGDFGIAFNDTCERKKPTDEQRQKWSQALNDVGNIEGEHFSNWNNEAAMIEKIAKEVLIKLNATPSRDFDEKVGLKAHLRKMESLLDLDYDGVKMVGITGPAGIGKTTIARALQSVFSDKFQLTCFVDNLSGNYHSGLDDYGLQLRLQKQLISKVLNQDGMSISHLGAVEQNLGDQRVLIILDDVNNIKQLEALANETTWFGPGSRIVVTTENKELLQQHGINNIYHVGFPSSEEAAEILCRYAFKQRDPLKGFKMLVTRVRELCGNLPLGLRVVGSSLRGKNGEGWEKVIRRLKTIIDHEDIENVLRVGFESLDENEQSQFLHIAVFFSCEDGDLVKAMLADTKFDIKHGLEILVNRSLIYISTGGKIMMHKLLQQVATKVVHREESWKQRILINAPEICDVLERAKGTRAVSGISFDISGIGEVSVSKKAFKRMPNLRFLRVYKSEYDGNDVLHIPEEMEFPCRHLRLLQWKAYPNKFLPPAFHPEYLVKLDMSRSKLKYLWKGTQPLTNLKEMYLGRSFHLKELPDLTNATNLEKLYLNRCKSLVEIPSSFSHLHKLETLVMAYCMSIKVIPPHLNLASLDYLNMDGCTKLRNFPAMSTHISNLTMSFTAVKDVPASTRLCSRLDTLDLSWNRKLKEISHLPRSLTQLNLSGSNIKKITESIKDLHQLSKLYLCGCKRLTSLPELPRSLTYLFADDCESLETVLNFPFNTQGGKFYFTNCFKLDQLTQRAITLRSLGSGHTRLPGREVPAEFKYRARGNSLTIRLDGNRPLHISFKLCFVISPNNKNGSWNSESVVCRRIVNGHLDPYDEGFHRNHDFGSNCRTEHLFVFDSNLQYFHSGKVSSEVVFEFSSRFLQEVVILECGAHIQSINESEPLEDDA